MTPEEHDLIHMMVRARQWFKMTKKILVHAEEWFEEMDEKIQKIVEKNYNDLHAQIQIIKDKISNLNEEIDGIQMDIREIQDIQKSMELLQVRIDEEMKSRGSYEILITQNKRKIDTQKDSRVNMTSSKKKLNNLSDYLEFVKILCKDEHVKQYAISSIMPRLNRQVNHYLSESGMNFYVKLNNWLDATIEGPGMTNSSYGSLSGGEARSIDLSLQFGFLDVARIRAGVFPDLLTLDELLDSSVDSIGLSSILDIVRTRQKEDNSKIFIITHRQEVDSSIPMDNIYQVEKRDGFSYVELKVE